MVQHAVLRLDVPMEHAPLMQVHHSKEGLREVVSRQGLRETTHSMDVRGGGNTVDAE